MISFARKFFFPVATITCGVYALDWLILKGNTELLQRPFLFTPYLSRSFCHAAPKKLQIKFGIFCKSKEEDDKGFKPPEIQTEVRNRPKFCICDCGEDAYFLTETKSHTYFGVADGVGGWRSSGVDPALFAWALVENCRFVAAQQNDSDPTRLLGQAYDKLLKDQAVKAGSSTACIASIDKETFLLKVANLGDSGLMVIRGGKVVFRTYEQQHYFNAPYQLSVVPGMSQQNNLMDKPTDAAQGMISLQSGDIIIIATDGIFDNMFDTDIFSTFPLNSLTINSLNADTEAQKMAQNIVSKSRVLADDEQRMSPFSKNALKHRYYMRGGKMDDMTVIVGIVVEEEQ